MVELGRLETGRAEYLAGLVQQQLGRPVEKRRNLIVQVGQDGDPSVVGHVRQGVDALVQFSTL